ncbi:MAG: class I SAM-dependent methyltransferase [Solirubrobacteraceae bacterium]
MSPASDPSVPAPAEVWSSGDYAAVCDRMIPELGARLVELAGVRAGHQVLDVAAGSGNAALRAARVGAVVTALDITPDLLEEGARRAGAAGVEVDWVEGDAQALPFADAGFDHVLSCVGVQFCADHDAVASELVRVCRPGGRITLISWTPEGFIGQVLAAVSRATGAAGSGASPLDWGRESILRGWFEPAGDVMTRREDVNMPAESAVAWVDYMAAAYGPLVRARDVLAGRGVWAPLRDQLCEIAASHNAGDADRFAARAEYLVATIDR